MRLLLGDMREELRTLEPDSIDAVVCDPPYELGFMGKAWDRAGVSFQAETWAEVFRVLKPGGHLLAFGGTRTYHRIAVAIEDAGFDVRDQIVWLYGSGFPKSLDAAKAIDKAKGVEGGYGEPKTAAHAGWIDRGRMRGEEGHEGYQRPWMADEEAVDRNAREYLPASEEAVAWQGWGTALKPAMEPIVVARKPLVGTVAANLLEHGVGAINVDACRIDGVGRWPANVVLAHTDGCVLVGAREVASNGHFPSARPGGVEIGTVGHAGQDALEERRTSGETVEAWECVEECPVRLLDEQTGDVGAAAPVRGSEPSAPTDGIYGEFERLPGAFYGDGGGASRFFYTAKTSRAERNAGLDGFEKRPILWSSGEQNPGSFQADGTDRAARNNHPTVKPVELMRWLVRLVTPPGGTVLDPFLGSGTTGIAAGLEGFDFVGVERDPDYLAIAEARIRFWSLHGEQALDVVRRRDEADRRRSTVADSGQLDLLGYGGTT